MDLAGKARRLERKITRAVDAAVTEFVGQSTTAPIEIVHAVLARAEDEIQEIGRGERLFPYDLVRVHVTAAPQDSRTRARFTAVVDGPPSLAERLLERLRAAGCRTGTIATEVAFTPAPGPDWADPAFHVEFERTAMAAPAVAAVAEPLATEPTATEPWGAQPPATESRAAQPRGTRPPPVPPATGEVRLKLTVVKGTAAQRVYVFTGGRIDLGRRAEVLDQRQRLIRTNHVAFADDGPDPNASVSRRHAHIEFNSADGAYRIRDDGSAHGTNIVRQGRTIRVPAGTRGARLETGDEVVLGHARLRVSLEGPKKS